VPQSKPLVTGTTPGSRSNTAFHAPETTAAEIGDFSFCLFGRFGFGWIHNWLVVVAGCSAREQDRFSAAEGEQK